MNTEFKVGDSVMLKSSGPKMTIEALQNGRANCIWFSKNELCEKSFAVSLLVEYPKPVVAVFSSSGGRRAELDDFF